MATGRVPGPLGFSDWAGLLVNTRRPLGVNGTTAVPLGSSAHGEESHASHIQRATQVMKVASATRKKSASKILGTSGTHSSAERTLEEFKALVKEAQIRHLQTKGRHQFDDVPDAELEIIEGRFRMRKVAAKACRDLLVAARAACAEATAGKDAKAGRTGSIGIQSAYRNYAEDGAAWRRSFNMRYDANKHTLGGLAGGRHGEAALGFLTGVMIGVKAPPGWSNHSNGMAVDFTTTFGKHAYDTTASSGNRDLWRKTWLHGWLVGNARSFGFHPLRTEEWHWDFR